MYQLSPAAKAALIAAATATASVGLWLLGNHLDSAELQFIGFMIGASTFVPMPADAYVIAAAASLSPTWIGVVGGLINGLVVVGPERTFLRIVWKRPAMQGVRRFFDAGSYVKYLDKAMFATLLVSGFSFLPFEPFRFVAVARDYSPARYFLATALGRGIRYYWLARAGSAVADYWWSKYVVWALLAAFVVGLVSSVRKYRAQEKLANSDAPED